MAYIAPTLAPTSTTDPFAKPPVTPVPNFDVKGALTAIGSSISKNLTAAGQRATAPISSSPFASPSVNSGPPLAPKTQPLLAPGQSAFGTPAPITFGTVPGLTANFTTPPKTTSAAPAVVTADAANDHIDKMTTAANTATSDMQNAAATKAQLAATAAANAQAATDKTPTQPTTPAPTGTDTSDALDSIFSSLGGENTGDTNPTDTTKDQTAVDNTQNDALNTLNSENVIDSQTLQTVSDALTSMESGTMPLTPNEQAQVDNVKNTFSVAMRDAQTYAQNVQGGMAASNAGGENGGISEYSPQIAMANMASAIKIGSDKISTINSNIISAQNKLTTSLQAGDYKTASRLYSQISAGITSRNNEIDKINTSIQTHLDKMQTNALDVAKLEISTLTSKATQDATAAYRAQQLILSNTRLTDQERKTAFDELNTANGTRTAAERSAQALSQFGAAFVPGAKMADGTPTVDENGYITPAAFKAAIADAPAEGLTRTDFIKQFGSMAYSDSKKGIDGRAYGLTPAEIKLINGALPVAGS